MVYVYRTTDMAKWGLGKLAPITKVEHDNNNWQHHERLAALEAIAVAANNIINITLVGTTLTFIFADYTEMTVTLEEPEPPSVVPWLPDTLFLEKQWISAPNGGLYEINIDHTSDPYAFDPEATNGFAVDLYNVIVPPAVGTVPAGGAIGSVIRKADYNDYMVLWQSFAEFVDDVEAEISTLTPVEDVEEEHGQIARWNATDEEWKKQQDRPLLTITVDELDLVVTHIHKFLVFTHVSGCVITIPAEADWDGNLKVGQEIHFRQGAAVGLTFTEAYGVVVSGIDGFLNETDRLGAVATLYYAGDDTWYLYGLLAAE